MNLKDGEKVALRLATKEDLDLIYYWKYIDKEQAAKKWNGPYILDPIITKEEFQDKWEKNKEIFPKVPSTLIITVNNKFIGTVGSYWVDKNTNWLETGIVTYDKNFWNGGYGSEAYKLWIEYLFEKTNLHRLGMSTWSGNDRMMRVAEKVGMQIEAKIRDARVVNGQYYDAIKMGILRNEWVQINNNKLIVTKED